MPERKLSVKTEKQGHIESCLTNAHVEDAVELIQASV